MALAMLILATACAGAAEPAADKAVFRVTDKVLVKNPPRFGVNFDPNRFNHWLNWIPMNQWAKFSSFEPVVHRFQNDATGGSETTLVDQSRQSLGWWDSYHGNWWAGADIVVYRPGKEGMTLLRRGEVKSSVCGKGTENMLTFDAPGPAVREGERESLLFDDAF